MGYDLYSEKESTDSDVSYFRWNYWCWPSVLTLASVYGWEAKGTTFHPLTEADIEEHGYSQERQDAYRNMISEWEGAYDSNDGQVVLTEDALEMAKALEKALVDIPDGDIPTPGETSEGTIPIDSQDYEKHRSLCRSGNKKALAISFSGDNKIYLKQFIKFLRRGSFSIS